MPIEKIALLIPSYNRPQKLEPLLRNIRQTSNHATPYFIITSQDKDSQRELERIGANYMVFDGEYVASINYGVEQTEEEFILCGADDILFVPNWDTILLKNVQNYSIIGGLEEGKVGESKLHISHPLVRRSYVDAGLACGVKGKLYHPSYIHYMCDIELCQRGWQNKAIKVIDQYLIKHTNPMLYKKDNESYNDIIEKKFDATYKRSYKNGGRDSSVFQRRKGMFEMYVVKTMVDDGLVVPTLLNPEYQEERITIVIPSYNDTDVLLKCLEALVAKTYYPFDLILINDSGEWEKMEATPKVNYPHYINRIELFNSFEMEDKTNTIRVIHNDKQRWVGANWNLGAELAQDLEGKSVFFLNSDVIVQTYWDAYLVAALRNPHNRIVCPFQFVAHEKPYAFDLHKVVKGKVSHMINGTCFGMRQADLNYFFPIPKEMKHWGTDNVLSDRANKNGIGVKFICPSVVQHLVSVSSKRVDTKKFLNRIYADICAYEDWLLSEGLSQKEAEAKAKWIKDVVRERAKRAGVKLD